MGNETKEKELWLDTPNIKGYQVSNKGRVRSKRRLIINRGRTYIQRPTIFKIHKNKEDGYNFVILSRRGSTKKYYVHILVAAAFIGPNPDKSTYTVDHINRDRMDNNPDNLRYATKQEQDDNRVLNPRKGSESPNAKLKEHDIKRIRTNTEAYNITEWATLYSVSPSTISKIIKRETWKHVE